MYILFQVFAARSSEHSAVYPSKNIIHILGPFIACGIAIQCPTMDRTHLSRSSESLPDPTDAANAAACHCPLGRDDGGIPGLDAVDEEAVREATLVTFGDLFDADGAEFRVALVDISVWLPVG